MKHVTIIWTKIISFKAEKPAYVLKLILISVLCCSVQLSYCQRSAHISGRYYDWTKTMQPERPWVRDYNKTLITKIFLCSRDGNGNLEKVYLKFADALEVIRKLDNITLGLPKIVYLVGWQFNGHDSKYPSWAEVNKALKRDQDSTALQSLKWLIQSAKAYNTTVSLHINMLDAYEDSPLWQEYLDKDIIAKDKAGKPLKGEKMERQQSYQISYAQEWKTGETQRRIDGLLKMLPELKEGGTIHIDAFHSMAPLRPNQPISPYLHFSLNDEICAQRKIFRYWRSKGIDVTSEGGMYWLRKDPFIGLQAAIYLPFQDEYVQDNWLNKPAWFKSLPVQFSAYTPMHCEGEIKNDPDSLSGLPEQFCLNVVPWYFRRNADVAQHDEVIITDDEVICPVLWKDKALIAYTKLDDALLKRIKIPSTWSGVKNVQLYKITIVGLQKIGTLKVNNSMIELKLVKYQPTLIMPVE